MKVAVSAAGSDLNAKVDARFGRAPYFVIVDTETMAFEAVANTQNLQAAQGAGVQAAAHVARFKPAAVLTGNCGPKAFQTLKAAGITVAVNVAGTVKEAVQRYLDGDCELAAGPNVSGHWS
jgi:predicted Fe-Mo cluster-binding NifX family protein